MRHGTFFAGWRPSPLLAASAAVHLGAAAALLARPRAWPWALGALLANHVVLAAAGLWPRSQLLGANWTRLPQRGDLAPGVAITIDDGPDPEVTPRVLEMLENHAACATFFCIGERVLRYPDIAQEIVRRGHVIENHSQRHRHNFSLLGPKRNERGDIAGAREHRSRDRKQPAIFSRSRGTAQSVSRSGAGAPEAAPRQLDAPRLRYGQHGCRRGVSPPGKCASGGDILLLHDGNAARSRRGQPVILEVLPRLLDALSARGLKPVTLRSALPPP